MLVDRTAAFADEQCADKQAVFAARSDLAGGLAALLRTLELDRDPLGAAASDPQLLATDAAEALVQAERRFATRTSRSPLRCGTAASTRRRPRRAPLPARAAIVAARERLAAV